VIKLISFFVLTHFFHVNELKILRQPGYLYFFKLNQQYFFTVGNWLKERLYYSIKMA